MKYIAIFSLLILTATGCENKPLLECQQKNDVLNNEIAMLEDKLASSFELNQKYQSDTRTQVANLNKILLEKEQELKQLEELTNVALAQSKEQIQTLKTELNTSSNRITELQKLLESTKLAFENANNEKEASVQNRVELENKLAANQKQSTELSAQVETLQKQNAELQAKIKQLESEISQNSQQQSGTTESSGQ